MKTISEELKKIVDATKEQLNSIDNWNYRKAPEKWSKKEILGHLIDSAANNHQRFVRIQYENIPLISYDQNQWVAIQKFDDVPTNLLINFWASYNNLLAFIISKIPAEALERKCDIGKEEPVTLEWIATDYIRHLNHHLIQIVGEE